MRRVVSQRTSREAAGGSIIKTIKYADDVLMAKTEQNKRWWIDFWLQVENTEWKRTQKRQT